MMNIIRVMILGMTISLLAMEPTETTEDDGSVPELPEVPAPKN